MLRGHDDSLDGGGAVTVVADGDLGLPIGAELGNDAALAHLSESLSEAVRDPARQRVQLGSLVSRETEHDALIAGALRAQRVVVAGLARLQ